MEKNIILYIVLSFTYCIIDNPISLGEEKYPILLFTENDDYDYLLTQKKCLKINKYNKDVSETKDFIEYGKNYISIHDNSNKNYLYNEKDNNFYYIIFEPFCSYEEFQLGSTEEGAPNYGQITYEGSIALDNDFIVYGQTDKNYLFFISKTHNKFYYIEEKNKIESLSCKYIQGIKFICVMMIQGELWEVLIEYDPLKDSISDKFKIISNENDTPKP